MNIYYDLNALKINAIGPVVLTLGMFDGVHLGHQKVIAEAKRLALQNKAKLLAVTFQSHPISILKPETLISYIYPFDKKLELLQYYGVDKILALDFSIELSKRTAFEFLNMLHKRQPFSDLVVGYDATIGSDQENNRDHVLTACDILGVNIVYVDAVKVNETPVSSRRIKKLLNEGKTKEADFLLGGPQKKRPQSC